MACLAAINKQQLISLRNSWRGNWFRFAILGEAIDFAIPWTLGLLDRWIPGPLDPDCLPLALLLRTPWNWCTPRSYADTGFPANPSHMQQHDATTALEVVVI